jgi:hypothetical protein
MLLAVMILQMFMCIHGTATHGEVNVSLCHCMDKTYILELDYKFQIELLALQLWSCKLGLAKTYTNLSPIQCMHIKII